MRSHCELDSLWFFPIFHRVPETYSLEMHIGIHGGRAGKRTNTDFDGQNAKGKGIWC